MNYRKGQAALAPILATVSLLIAGWLFTSQNKATDRIDQLAQDVASMKTDVAWIKQAIQNQQDKQKALLAR